MKGEKVMKGKRADSFFSLIQMGVIMTIDSFVRKLISVTFFGTIHFRSSVNICEIV